VSDTLRLELVEQLRRAAVEGHQLGRSGFQSLTAFRPSISAWYSASLLVAVPR
jgi:hypothetical protein